MKQDSREDSRMEQGSRTDCHTAQEPEDRMDCETQMWNGDPEKRQSRRLDIKIDLSISELYKEDTNMLMDLDMPIEVTNISAVGIAFISECILPIGYYFIANIELSKALPQIITDVRIIRSSVIDNNHYKYGCEYVSISPGVQKLLEEYEKNQTMEDTTCN
ncbi:MAG: hypothetical protein GX567_14015 [Clostridia bacterium]|nr:hypothetical protein [Clostridia bacterium]